MKIDPSKQYIVYPSWAQFSYRWRDLPKLLRDPLSTKYLAKRNDWMELGYSRITDNFELIDGPFGNGIIAHDQSKIIDVPNRKFWLPTALLGSEAYFRNPPGVSSVYDTQYQFVSYLSPKPSDDVLLGLKREVEDPMPGFSLEPMEGGADGCALLCIGRTGSSALTEDLQQLPLFLRALDIKSELITNESMDELPRIESIQNFLAKWKLNGCWYFLDAAGYDVGHLFAVVVYLGSWLRHVNGSRIKTCHMATRLPQEFGPHCSRWSMKRLR